MESRQADRNDTIILSPYIGGDGFDRSTLGGIALVARTRYTSSVELYRSGAIPWTMISSGGFSHEYITSSESDINCNLTFSDPTPVILEGIRELTFRAAIAASNSTTTQSAIAHTEMFENLYQSHYSFLFAALLVPLLGVGFVFALLVGWWDLGWKVSLSPIEIAKALDAPMLAPNGSNLPIDKLIKSEIGNRKLKYGEPLEDSDWVKGTADKPGEGHEQRLAMGAPDAVTSPQSGAVYS